MGNSLGTTFSKELLMRAGITAEHNLEVTATHGELCIKRVSDQLLLKLTPAEVKAVAEGKFNSKAGESAVEKAKRLLDGKG
jgi:hypothetical protein